MINTDTVLKYLRDQTPKLEHNKTIYDIMEGDLGSHVEASLRKQLSGDSASIAIQRMAPINILVKIVKKLSTLYMQPPKRKCETDQELVDYYSEMANKSFSNFNENFNSSKMAAIEIYEDDRELKCRCVPSHLCLPYSDSKIDPLKLTAFIKIMGDRKIWVYTNDEFVSIDHNGSVVKEDMGDNMGVNPFGVIPFVYTQKSDYELIPKNDTDIISMTILMPVLLTDLNFCSMYLSMPILYGVDIDATNLKLSPNNFWSVKSEVDGKTPQLGVLKAEPDLSGQMKNITDQLNLWLSSKDIRPGAVGTVSSDNFSSGISKIISEMDTLENRKSQEVYMREAEEDFWYKLAVMHNELATANRIDNRLLFTNPEEIEVAVTYAEDRVIESRADLVARLKIEMDAGFISKLDAIKELYPQDSEDRIEERMEETMPPRFEVIDNGVPTKENT